MLAGWAWYLVALLPVLRVLQVGAHAVADRYAYVPLIGIFVPVLRNQAGDTAISLLGNVLLSGYGREHELEADRLGAEYLYRTGYDPQAMIKVIGVLKNQELFDAEIAKTEGRQPRSYHGVFASHPDADQRLQEVVGEAGKLAAGKGLVNQEEFLRMIDRMPVAAAREVGA